MTWEALSAIATAFTGLVIMFTVIVGVRQARAALDQIGEAHRATQLDEMMRISRNSTIRNSFAPGCTS